MITTPFPRETLSLLSYHPILNNALEFTQTTTLRFPNPWFACEMQNKLLVKTSLTSCIVVVPPRLWRLDENSSALLFNRRLSSW